MLSGWKTKLSKIASQVAEVVAPTPKTEAVRFAEAWHGVEKFYSDPEPNEHVSLEASRIPKNLEDMVNFLVAEEREREQRGLGLDVPGPCMEYLLENRIVETLSQLALTGQPKGIHSYILRFLVAFIQNMRQRLLPHVAIHRPLNRLIAATLEAAESRTMPPFVKLLHTLATVLQRDRSMVGFLVSDDASNAVTLPLLQGLIANMNPRSAEDQSSDVAALARAGLLILLSLESDFVYQCCLRDGLAGALGRGLCLVVEALPAAVDGGLDSAAFVPVREHTRFLSQVASLSLPHVVRAIGSALADALVPLVRPRLLAPAEDAYVTGCEVVTALVLDADHVLLADALARAVLGDRQLRDLIIRRIDSLSARQAQASLALCYSLLASGAPLALELLVASDARLRCSALCAQMETGRPRALEQFLVLASRLGPPPPAVFDAHVTDAAHQVAALAAAAARFQRMANAASRAGIEASSASGAGATGAAAGDDVAAAAAVAAVAAAGVDAGFVEAPAACSAAGAGATVAVPAEVAAVAAAAAAPAGEASLLAMLFNRLEGALDAPLQTNLAVTAVLGLLAAAAEPTLHALLLSAEPSRGAVRTAFGVMSALMEDAAARCDALPDAAALLRRVRASLAGESSSAGAGGGGGDDGGGGESLAVEGAAQACVVAELFCLDLAALALAQAAAAGPPRDGPTVRELCESDEEFSAQ